MKKIVLVLVLFCLGCLITMAQNKPANRQKKDTAKVIKKPYKPHLVKGRKARMRLQLEQIKKHKNQLKEVDSVQKKLDKETRKSN